MMPACAFTFCDREQGLGTWMQVTIPDQGAPFVLPVCEEHWQAVRNAP